MPPLDRAPKLQLPLTITELYELHESGELGHSDPRWERVGNLLQNLASAQVRGFTRSRNFHGIPLEQRIDDVHASLMGKFIRRKFKIHNSVHNGSLEPLLRCAARNDLISAFRKSKSPCTVMFDGAEHTWRDDRPAVREPPDLFAVVRINLPPFRFPEHPHVREALLAYFLTRHNYPGPSFIHRLVAHRPIRACVYNVALFDLNRAMVQHVGD